MKVLAGILVGLAVVGLCVGWLSSQAVQYEQARALDAQAQAIKLDEAGDFLGRLGVVVLAALAGGGITWAVGKINAKARRREGEYEGRKGRSNKELVIDKQPVKMGPEELMGQLIQLEMLRMLRSSEAQKEEEALRRWNH